jgi:putative ABC transport system ATP-binding protein
MSILRAVAVDKVYSTRGIETRALSNIDLTINAGEFSALAGPSGSGKTTLLNLLGALDIPTAGQILLEDEDLASLSPAALSDRRLHKLGFVFQAYNLIPVLSAAENVEFVLELQGIKPKERRERSEALLERVGLGDMAQKRPLEMSGGQQQRVAVARAIASQPRIILADEPTANLDSTTARNLLELMHGLNQDEGITFLFSSHDPLVLDRANRRILLRDGQIEGEEQGPRSP